MTPVILTGGANGQRQPEAQPAEQMGHVVRSCPHVELPLSDVLPLVRPVPCMVACAFGVLVIVRMGHSCTDVQMSGERSLWPNA